MHPINTGEMDHGTLEAMRRAHPAWRLLAASHAALIIGFLHAAFVKPNARSFAQADLAARLDDHLHALREAGGEDPFPKSSARYLDDWASEPCGWLRKYYPPASDEPHYDLTPAAEKAIEWIANLKQRQFVGTESRLMTVFELLRQIVEGSEMDPLARIGELEKRKSQIEGEIARIKAGDLALMDATHVKDRFQQIDQTARGLLADFRAVEHSFRDLDRQVRERVATWESSRGALLATIFGERDAITASDQGKSFRAFWDFLMSPARQEELSHLLERAFALAPVQELKPDPRLLRVHYDWLEAGEVAQRTVARLSEQLRRYLDDKAWLENRRIMQLIRQVEQHALALRAQPPAGAVIEIDDIAPDIDLAVDRPLFAPPFKPSLDAAIDVAESDGVPVDALFDQVRIDKAELTAAIRRALQLREQVALSELVEMRPLDHGLGELVAYLTIAADDAGALIDDSRSETISWVDAEGRRLVATLPLVIFSRAKRGSTAEMA